MFFQGLTGKEEETEEEIDYPFQVTLPAKESSEESSDETTTDSSSDENLPGLFGEIVKKSKESQSFETPEIKLEYFEKNEDDDFQSNPVDQSNFISYIEIIQESNAEWAIELAKQIQSKDDLAIIPSKEKKSYTPSQKFRPFKFKAVSNTSFKIVRNVQNDFKMEPAMGETYVSPNDSFFMSSPSINASKKSISQKRKLMIAESSDDNY